LERIITLCFSQFHCKNQYIRLTKNHKVTNI
jgi:hypothetical protein